MDVLELVVGGTVRVGGWQAVLVWCAEHKRVLPREVQNLLCRARSVGHSSG